MSYYINPNAILDNSIKQSSLPVKVQEKVDLYHINKQKPPIVGRCIPLNPEEGNRYYFADDNLKVKSNNKLGFYYINPGIGRIIFTIPKKNTRNYIDLCEALNSLFHGNFSSPLSGNSGIDSSVLKEFPILNSCIKLVDSYTSSTRSPYVTINNGKLVVDKPLIYSIVCHKENNRLDIYPNPVYYHYKNNNTSIKNIQKIAYDGVSWENHRKKLNTIQYKCKYTYRRIRSKNKLVNLLHFQKRGHYKVCSIWRRYKVSQSNVLYFTIIYGFDFYHTKISNKLKDKYK